MSVQQWKNYHYRVTDKGIVITKYEQGPEEILCIPFQIDGLPVVEIGEEALAENGSLLARIEVPSSVRRIGNGAFKMCMNLTELVLHDGLESIGAEALYLTPLEEIVLPDTVREIEEPWEMSAIRIRVSPENPRFFTDGFCLYQRNGAEQELLTACQQEERAEYCVAHGTTVVGESAFAGTESLKRIVLPDSVHTIRESAFEGCTGLEEIMLPETFQTNSDSVERVSESGRREWRESLDAKNREDFSGLRCIGDHAFSHCICLKEIYLPSTVEKIGKLALSDTFGWSDTLIGLEKITVSDANIHFTADENALFEIGQDKDRYLVKYFGQSSAYRIPADVSRILPGAFRRAKLRKCQVPASVQDVGEDAFRECAALEELVLEESGLRLYVPRQPIYRKDEVAELFYSAEREARLEKFRETQPAGKNGQGKWSVLEFPEKWKDFAVYYPKPRWEMKTQQEAITHGENTMGAEAETREETAAQQKKDVRKGLAERSPKEKRQKMSGDRDQLNPAKRYVYDYQGYDVLFPTYLNVSEKCGMACCRLQCPVQLTESAAAEYREFITENLTDILRDISKTQDIDCLADLAGLGFFTEHNIGDCMDMFARAGSVKCTGFLLNYQREHLGEDAFDFSL